jgi:hypothetical protein
MSDRAQRNLQDLLTPIYDWFTEGFDTLDLKEAKAMLGGWPNVIACGTERWKATARIIP